MQSFIFIVISIMNLQSYCLLLYFSASVRDVLENVKTVRPVDSWKKDDAEDMDNESSGK